MEAKEIAENIKRLRTKQGIRQKELAEKIGKSETTIGNYESGDIDIPLSSLIKIAEALGADIKELFGEEAADFQAERPLRIYREDDRRPVLSILGMNGYTVRQVKVAREGKKSSWYCVQAKLQDGNVMSS